MALPDTTFNDLSPDEQKLAWAVYNKVTESSLDFDEQTLASSVDRVLMVNAAGTAAGTASLSDLVTGLDGKYQSNLANIQDYLGVDVSKKRNLFKEDWSIGDMNLNTGTVTSGSNLVSDFMEVEANKSYYSTGDAKLYACYYDASHGYIGRTYASGLNNRQFSTPANAKYMRFLYAGTSAPSIAIFEGSEPQPYVPYRKLINNNDVLSQMEIDATTSFKATDVLSVKTWKDSVVRYSKNFASSVTETYTVAIPLSSISGRLVKVYVLLSHSQDFYGKYEEYAIRTIGNYSTVVTVASRENASQYNNFTMIPRSDNSNQYLDINVTTGSSLGHHLTVYVQYI